MILTID